MKADLPYWWKFREIVYSTRKSFARKLTISYNDKNFVNLPKKLQFSQIYLICKVTNWEVYGVFLASQNYGKIKKKMGSVYFPNFQKWMINKWSVYGVRVSVGPCIFLIPPKSTRSDWFASSSLLCRLDSWAELVRQGGLSNHNRLIISVRPIPINRSKIGRLIGRLLSVDRRSNRSAILGYNWPKMAKIEPYLTKNFWNMLPFAKKY